MKTILITGATDGIGLETARRLAGKGHTLLLSGRNARKLEDVRSNLAALNGPGPVKTYRADLSDLSEVRLLAEAILEDQPHIDVLINNAGILKTPNPVTSAGLDARFAVNTLAPYVLTRRLLTIMRADGRVINLSSAAQETVNLDALRGKIRLNDMQAYSQSKLAITMWSRQLAEQVGAAGPVIVAVNPGSLLARKMVTEGFGIAGNDIGIGADILVRAALSPEFKNARGKYFDNDAKIFANPHRDALDPNKVSGVMQVMADILAASMPETP